MGHTAKDRANPEAAAAAGSQPFCPPAISQQMKVEYGPGTFSLLRDLGRSEDLAFSPDGRRIAIAGFIKNRIAVFDIELVSAGHGLQTLHLRRGAMIEADALQRPHGVDFITSECILVGNRGGCVQVIDVQGTLPETGKIVPRHMPSISRVGYTHRLGQPGSVAVLPPSARFSSASLTGNERRQVLICDNAKDRITLHPVPAPRRRWPFSLPDGQILLANGLDLPDGLAVSSDGRWIAVSNHNTHNVAIYERARGLNPTTPPAAQLGGVNHPHGLAFSPDARCLYVASAGAPCVSRFRDDTATWHGSYAPDKVIRVMDDHTFQRGRDNPAEGGPKGLAIHPSGSVMALTAAHYTLAVFDLKSAFAG
ncbi:YncE family protein [Pseudohoeflea coraliihabitans]|uniref:Uncharacterized protein n=1 Tax=Pseudohoeflea coraliihabitans TaxID=2860393 RepID=A0ABS6WM18_9HYPH|nr:hypothetical protein [Pseudohoeflea sp. DP4N28-3]MBW3097012.1 hypothetical protein [Pseudohoeflea sp. DP4N28-3]